MTGVTSLKKITLNLPVDLVSALQEISVVSNVTFTELLCAGLQVVKTGYEAEAAGKLIMVVNVQDGQAERVLAMPKHGVQEVSLPTGLVSVKAES
jgi:hypothetical protein